MSSVPEKLTDDDLCGEDHGDHQLGWIRHTIQRGFGVQTSLPHTEAWHRAAILSIVDSDCIKAAECINTVIELGHYVIHPAEARDKTTGELHETLRTILIQSSGPPIAFSSTSIIKAIQKIVWQSGKEPPFDPPLKVRLKQRAGGKGHIYYLQLVD